MVSEIHKQAIIKAVRQMLVLHDLFRFSSTFFSTYALVFMTQFREMLQDSKHVTCMHEFIIMPKLFLSKAARYLQVYRPNFL